MYTHPNPSGSRLEVVVTAEGKRIRRFVLKTDGIPALRDAKSTTVRASKNFTRKEARR